MTRQPTRWGSIALVTATVLSIVAVVLIGLRITVLDEGRFSNALAASLSKRPVRELVGERTAAAIVDARPDLSAVEPLIDSGVRTLAASSGARSIVRAAGRQLHRSLVDDHRDSAVLVASNLALLGVQALKVARPSEAERVPDRLTVGLVSLQSGEAATVLRRAASVSSRLRVLSWVGALVALALLVAVVLLQPDRRRGLRGAARTLIVSGLVSAVVLRLAVELPPTAVHDAGARAAARAVLSSVLGAAVNLGLGVAAVGGVLAIAAHVVTRGEPVAELARDAFRTVRGHRVGRVVMLVTGLALGLLLLFRPGLGAQLLSVAAGVALAVVCLEGLLRELLRGAPMATAAAPERRRLPSRRALAAGAVVLAALIAVGLATRAATVAPARADGRCNGLRALCDHRLDQVVLPATHNSMSASRDGFLLANQRTGIAAQLDGGVRGLLIDTHIGVKTPKGVYTLLSRDTKSREKLEDELGPSASRTALRIRAQLGYRGGGDPRVYLCHGFCELGATPAVDQLRAIHDFLVTHPGEVVVISVEDGASPREFAGAVADSGLLPQIWKGRVDPLPTLGTMIRKRQRVLVLAEERTGNVPWLHKQFELAQETPYDLPNATQVLGPRGCRANRGGTTPPMLILNAFVSAVPPPASAAKRVNAEPTLTAHARTCERERARVPTLLAVDHWELGDVVGAARALNGGR